MKRLRQVLRSRGSDTSNATKQYHDPRQRVPATWGAAVRQDELPPPYAPSARFEPDMIEREGTDVWELEALGPQIHTRADDSLNRPALCVMSNNINTGFLVKEQLLKNCSATGCLFCKLLLCATRTVSKASDRSIRVDFSNEESPILRLQLFRPNILDALSTVLCGRWEIYQHKPGKIR